MAIEIERKFLVCKDTYRRLATAQRYCQGYISRVPAHTVRVRLTETSGYLTVKGPVLNLVRSEFEYPIPREDAREMLELFCVGAVIVKMRYEFTIDGFLWAVDEFLGANEGLVVAEVEMAHVEQIPPLPDWVGQEVTGDRRYYNSHLLEHPYNTWDSTAS